MQDRILSSLIGWWNHVLGRAGWSVYVSKRTWVSLQASCAPIAVGGAYIAADAAQIPVRQYLSMPQAVLSALMLGMVFAVSQHRRWDDDQSTLVRRRK